MKKFFLIALFIVVVDQITKTLFKNIYYGIFNYTTNTGAAFSLFQRYTIILTIFSVLVIFLILLIYKKMKGLEIPLALLLGGTIGNLIDRVLFGYVRDFIDLGAWPVFNIADASNTIGVLLLIYMAFKEKF